MNRLFLRFLGPVLLSIALATVFVYAAITWLFGDPIEQNAMRQAAPQVFLIEQYIDKAAPDEWLSRLNKVREVSQVSFELLPLTQVMEKLSRTQRDKLRVGEIVLDVPNRSLYRRVDLLGERYIGSDEDVLIAQELPIDYWFNVKLEILRYFIVALVVLIPIAFWSRGHWRDIQTLSKVTEDFGAGRLSVRANLPSNANIYPLAAQINEMAARIEQLLGTHKNLLHSVSHELRTPIARLEFALEILQNSANDVKSQDRINAMQGDLGELNTLVSELLNMAKLDQQHSPLQLSLIHAESLLERCVNQLPPYPAQLQVHRFVQAQVPDIYGDPRLLPRAIVNLLKNALKYAHKEIRLSIVQDADRSYAGVWRISVEDDGPGIPLGERARVFEAFYRLDRSRDRATGGFGLGLSIVKQIVELHHGRIEIRDSELGGAKFVIHLPALTPEQPS